ncbi:uncharacterized protein ACMZJ9_017923 isoform 4-T5 [Mantella aurantiaca]
MPSCIVKGCKHHTSMKSSNPLLTMHVFPRELGRIKLWLQETSQDFGDIDAFAAKILDAAKSGKYRICSAHFDPGCYTTVGCRLVLKHDAVPTVFPGVYPALSSDWKSSPHARKDHMGLDVLGTYASRFHENVSVTKLSFLRKDAATQTNAEYDKTRPISLNTSLMERCNKQEEIFDASGRLIGVFSPDSQQRDLKVRPGLWTYDWSTQVPKEASKTHPPMENKEALSSLEKVLLSLLKHMAEAPHTRPQKQRTSRLLNRAAEIISILTGEEWTVVKKNAHISKFYQMIREVPIKCGDVAMFFTMDEWEYIEEHEDLYKPVMLENTKDGKKTPSHTDPDSSQEKTAAFQQQPSINAYHSAGKKEKLDIGHPPDCHRTPKPIGMDYKALQIVQAKQSITPDRPKPCPSSLSGLIRNSALKSPAHTAKHEESLKEEKDVDPSHKKNFTGDTHQKHSANDEGFVKKEENVDTHMMENPTDDIITESHCDPPPRNDSSPAAVGHKWGMKNQSHQSESSELWIAHDGTTSSLFIPEEGPRPPGWTHKTYSRKPLLPQCSINLSSDTDPPDIKLDCSRSDQRASKRATPESEHCCHQCNKHFPDKYQLTAHQKMHTKQPRR